MKLSKKRVEAHKVERAVTIIMLFFGACAVAVFGFGLNYPRFGRDAMIIEMFLIVLLAILAQTVILVRLLEKFM